VLRTILHTAFSLLVIAALLFGGMVPCPHACCPPTKQCGRVQVVETVAVLADVWHADAPVAVVTAVPVRVEPPVRLAAEPLFPVLAKVSPPDLCLLHSTFLI
jgi:hypothetical protein